MLITPRQSPDYCKQVIMWRFSFSRNESSDRLLAQGYVLGVMNSLPFDWIARRYVETNLNFFILNSFTFPPPNDTPWQRIGRLAARLSCADERFAEFAAEVGVWGVDRSSAQRHAGGDRRTGRQRLRSGRRRAPLHIHRLHRERGQPRLPAAGAGEVRRPVGRGGVTLACFGLRCITIDYREVHRDGIDDRVD